MSDLIAEASLAMRPPPETTTDSGEESSEGVSFPDPLWVQFFKAKCQENRLEPTEGDLLDSLDSYSKNRFGTVNFLSLSLQR